MLSIIVTPCLCRNGNNAIFAMALAIAPSVVVTDGILIVMPMDDMLDALVVVAMADALIALAGEEKTLLCIDNINNLK